jgi:hypothetical protein
MQGAQTSTAMCAPHCFPRRARCSYDRTGRRRSPGHRIQARERRDAMTGNEAVERQRETQGKASRMQS